MALPISGLIGHWKLDGNTLDSQGSNHGTPMNLTYAAGGIKGQAAVFNGTSSRIVVANPANFRSPTWTVSAWIRGTYNGDQSIFESWDQTSGFYSGFQLRLNNGFGAQITLGNLTGFVYVGVAVGTSTGWTNGDWRHIAASFDGSRVRIYFQGVPVLNQVAPINNVFNAATRVTIGTDEYVPGNFAYWLNGALDEIVYYNRVLSDAEVLDVFKDPIGPPVATAPTISNLTPTPSTTIAKTTPIQFDVTDAVGFGRVRIYAVYLDGREEVIYRGGPGFADLYSGSAISTITGGWHFSVIRNGGWPVGSSTPKIVLDVTNGTGQENA